MTTINSTRTFGIEIECFGPTQERAQAAIQAAGITCNIESYGHATPSDWKIVPDSSVSNGFEVVSPPLSGNAGLAAVKTVAMALVSVGAKVDRRCGFHVHVNARDLSGADLINIVKRYADHENEIDGFMPLPRRQNSNNYCRAMADIVESLEGLSGHENARSVAQRISERYYKLNLCAFIRHGTVEFRQHAGTVDYRKMNHWIAFCVQFVEDSRTQFITEMPPEQTVVTRTDEEIKFGKLAETLDQYNSRSNTIEPAALAAAMEVDVEEIPSYVSRLRTRYPAVSIQCRRGRGYYRECQESLAEIIGLVIRPNVRIEIPQDRGLFANLSPEISSYFQERAMDLSVA